MIEDWVEQHIDSHMKFSGNGQELHVNCPFCNDTRYRLYINLHTESVYCHNCGFASGFIGLIQRLEGLSYSRATSVYKDYIGTTYIPEKISSDELGSIFESDLRGDLEKRAIPLPEEYTRIPENYQFYPLMNSAVRYMKSRRITRAQILGAKMGVCSEGDYARRIIIPITEYGELRFWIARAMSAKAKLKEKSPSDQPYQISKSEVIFNIDKAAAKYHSAVICEGIFDAMSFGDIGISLLGKTLYQSQLNILLDYRELLTDGVYIALDWDAQDKAYEIAKELSSYLDVYVVNIPKYLDDPNNCLQRKGRAYMWKLLSEAQPYGEFSSLACLLR